VKKNITRANIFAREMGLVVRKAGNLDGLRGGRRGLSAGTAWQEGSSFVFLAVLGGKEEMLAMNGQGLRRGGGKVGGQNIGKVSKNCSFRLERGKYKNLGLMGCAEER